MRHDPTDGEPNSKNWDEFGGGILAPRKPAVYNPDGEKVQPEMGDKWQDENFNIKGPDITKIIDTTWG